MADNSSGVGAVWFVAGAAVGATLALLFAPESGAKTRRRLTKHAQRGSRALQNGGRDLYDRGRDVYDRGREIAEEAAEMFERGRKLAEKRVDDLL